MPPHHDLQPPPEALVRTLASSAAASLLFHPDFADAFTSHEDDGGVFSEQWRADESDDYSRLVAEVCSCLLLVPRASKSSGGGVGGGGGGELSSENDTNDQPEIDRNEAVIIHTGMDSSPAAPSSSPLSLPACYPRAKDRSQLLLSVVQLVDETAEEIACEMQKEPSHPAHKNRHLQGKGPIDSGSSRDLGEPPSSSSRRWCYDDALQRMTNGLWELACGVSMPIDAIGEDNRAAFLRIENAIRLVQEWLRRQWKRRKTQTIISSV